LSTQRSSRAVSPSKVRVCCVAVHDLVCF
jgi:hypothetical protein